MAELLVETAEFADHGGWVLDTQCIEATGSSYLMAHGLGKPVGDAVTQVQFAANAPVHFYVRTRDWTGEWTRGDAAGQFDLWVDGEPLPQILGNEKSFWHWQYAGTRTLKGDTHEIRLRDLTGFNGRCAAVYLTTDAAMVPPDAKDKFLAWRRQRMPLALEDGENYDLIVAGGGYAGICTAYSAWKLGLKVLLIHDRMVLGGCGSSEIRVWAGGMTHLGKYPGLGNVSKLISPVAGQPGMRKDAELFEDDRKRLLFALCPGVLCPGEAVTGIEMDERHSRRIKAVISRNLRTGQVTRRAAKLFADCTGDALLARLANCETMYGRESSEVYGESLAPRFGDLQVMGHSTLWETRELETDAPFPDINWGISFDETNAIRRFDCCWDWETGQTRHQVNDIEHIRDYGLMTCFANWSYLKNRAPDRDCRRRLELCWISALGGKRESYRVRGDLVLSQRDIEQKIAYPDGTAALSWSIDLHYPDPENVRTFGEAFQSCAYHRGIGAPYQVPYRCLYARDADNLLLGGRIVSASHVAFSSVRVMRTLGMLGEVIAMAAAVCRRHDCLPRDVYHRYWSDMTTLLTQGIEVGLPHAYTPDYHQAFHFMRPVGRFGNADENIWIRLSPQGKLPENTPVELQENIRKIESDR